MRCGQKLQVCISLFTLYEVMKKVFHIVMGYLLMLHKCHQPLCDEKICKQNPFIQANKSCLIFLYASLLFICSDKHTLHTFFLVANQEKKKLPGQWPGKTPYAEKRFLVSKTFIPETIRYSSFHLHLRNWQMCKCLTCDKFETRSTIHLGFISI